MSDGPRARTPGKSPWLLLVLVLTALFAWSAGGLVSAGGTASTDSTRAAFAPADRLLPAGVAHIAPVDAPDQDDLETLSEQLEDPLLAFGQHVIGLEAASEAEQAAHGAVRGWAVLARSFRSSSARGPPLN